MSGAPDPLYVEARRVLLDAAEALAAHLDSIVLVGAQAIYVHTGDADLAVAEFTTDANFGINPKTLDDDPLIASLLSANGFSKRSEDGYIQPGGWLSASGILLDLLVPEAVAGRGRRSADLGPHGNRAARRAVGLEGCWVDNSPMRIEALVAEDQRAVTMRVAGPGALLVAKLHKLEERAAHDDRVKDKDALDIFRLLRAIQTEPLAARIRKLLASEQAGAVTERGLLLLSDLFGTTRSVGVRLAQRASELLVDPENLQNQPSSSARIYLQGPKGFNALCASRRLNPSGAWASRAVGVALSLLRCALFRARGVTDFNCCSLVRRHF